MSRPMGSLLSDITGINLDLAPPSAMTPPTSKPVTVSSPAAVSTSNVMIYAGIAVALLVGFLYLKKR